MNGASERQSLLPPPQTRHDSAVNEEAVDSVLQRQEDRARDRPLMAVVLAIVVYTWYIVITAVSFSKLDFFAAHPPLQTLAVLAFAIGILTLQPTLSASSKAAGRVRHQIFQLGLGVPLLLAGSLAIIIHKQLNGWTHIKSAHSIVGLISIILIVLQGAIGAASLWHKGAAVGGEERGKALWKWHRLSGYIILPLLLLTVALGGSRTFWARMWIPREFRIPIFYISPVIAVLGLWARARIHKMPMLGWK
ncbi:hypothetical protein BDV93DRAFT_507448 [Ceratobasidium sp. AG-I]|nr:hypothetical protein BDV93DRAFT_507448 [Ceratobasidium sp. AG-I]